MSTTTERIGTNSNNADQACINNDQASDVNASATDPSTQLVNPDDSSLHTSTQQPGSEATTHPLLPLVMDIEPNISRANCPSHELASELAAEGLHAPNER
jgi:hypothetical protein